MNIAYNGTDYECQPCPICPKYFYRRYYLYVHLRKVHKIETPKCPNCNEKMKWSKLLNNNICSNCPALPTKFQCDECPKKYCYKGNLNRHKQTDHIDKERKFVCPMCGKKFKLLQHLKSHLLGVHRCKTKKSTIDPRKVLAKKISEEKKRQLHQTGTREPVSNVVIGDKLTTTTTKSPKIGRVDDAALSRIEESIEAVRDKVSQRHHKPTPPSPFECEPCGRSFRKKVRNRITPNNVDAID
jgi:uncharacterized Zn-finger protein